MPNDDSLAEYGYENASELADDAERKMIRRGRSWESDDEEEELDLSLEDEDEFLEFQR